MMQAATATTVTPEITRLPPANFSAGSDTTEVKDFVSAPNISNAIF